MKTENPQTGTPKLRIDISQWRIDPSLPAQERLRIFAEESGNPYHFRVGDTEVSVVYSDGAPDLQRALTALCERLQ